MLELIEMVNDAGKGSVIDISSIERGCHLIPIWKNKDPSTWNAKLDDPTVALEHNSRKWLLNKHIDRWSYWELY
jgi:hypothetical protein